MLAQPNMRILIILTMLVCTVSCRDSQRAPQVKDWEPKGFFDMSEALVDRASNHTLLFATGSVTHFLPDGSHFGMGWFEKTNGGWVWHVFANRWQLQPDGDSLLCSEIGNPKVPWLGKPTNSFHMKRRASLANEGRK